MLTFGTIFAIVVLSICGLAILVGFAACFLGDDPIPGIGTIAAALVIAFTAQFGFMIVGYSSDYMAYKPISGQVEEIAKRQIADGKGMAERFVFVIDGQQYGVDDTRAALVKPGATVNLNCTKEFVFGSTNNGYACNWG